MKEHDDYWQHDEAIGEAHLQRDNYAVRMKLHQSAERHRGPIDLIPGRSYTGERLYHHAKFYVLVPEITLTIGLFEMPQGRNIGEVTGSTWEGMRHQEIGQGQAWYYAGDRLLVLWECYLEDPFRQKDPTADKALAVAWQGFERFLLERLHDAERIVTPGWEPIYPEKWQEFLEQMGYTRLGKRAFEKRP